MLQILPIGIQTFSKLREGNYLYVDKTEHIFRLLQTGSYYFLSRPRRFGKSLTLSTIYSIYKGEKHFFDGLWIENKWNWKKKHPVIHIQFNELSYQNGRLEKALKLCLAKNAMQYDVVLLSETLAEQFYELLEKIAKKHGKVVLLIDEYDKPLIDYLEKDEIHIAKEHQKILKAFYAIIKPADPYIEFLIITGVSKFSKVSIFSDLNHLDDITLLDRRFSTLVGYTFEEIKHYFKDWLVDVHQDFPDLTFDELLENIKEWYNGYTWDSNTYVYNPFSILNFCNKREFVDYWFKTGTPTFLIKLLREREAYNFANLKIGIELFDSHNLDNLETISLLFQTGYLTIKSRNKDNILTLDYPNREVAEAMYKHLIAAFGGGERIASFAPVLQLRDAFFQNDLEKVVVIVHSLFKDIPYDLFKNQSELLYHALIHLVFKYLGIFIQSEVETSNGRLDAVVYTATHIYIIEFKIDKTAADALAQIKQNNYAAKFALEGKTLVGLGINFSTILKGVENSCWEIL